MTKQPPHLWQPSFQSPNFVLPIARYSHAETISSSTTKFGSYPGPGPPSSSI